MLWNSVTVYTINRYEKKMCKKNWVTLYTIWFSNATLRWEFAFWCCATVKERLPHLLAQRHLNYWYLSNVKLLEPYLQIGYNRAFSFQITGINSIHWTMTKYKRWILLLTGGSRDKDFFESGIIKAFSMRVIQSMHDNVANEVFQVCLSAWRSNCCNNM